MSTHARVETLRAAATSPLVSVLLSTRDGSRYLQESLSSLAAQTYPNVEIVAVDDGSSDGSPEILARFAAAHPRTRVIRTEGIGLAAALHRAAGEAAGLLYARQDDDDRSHPERFERQVRYFHLNADAGVVGTTATRIGANGEALGPYPVPLTPGAIAAALRRGTPFVHGSVMIRREAYEASGGYRAAFEAAQDVDLWLRMPREFRFANLDRPLYEWRAHPGGVFARARDRQLFFGAAARAFAEERRARGSNGRDSVAILARAETTEAFLEEYARRDRVERHWAESLVREGRVAEARAMLRRAMRAPRSAAEASLWWAISWPAGLLPRARRR
ncbi:MAG TPA: glycosyltransferase [Acidobacteriota bacterium]|nr:glycosyltransferase [Acidobacteriota bacterium]